MADWGLTSAPVTQNTWVRSYSQVFNTDLGQDFKITAYLQQVTTVVDASGNSTLVSKEELTPLVMTESQAAADPEIGPLAQTLQATLTQILGILYQRTLPTTGA